MTIVGVSGRETAAASPPFPDAPAEFRIGLAPIPLDAWLQADAGAAARKDALLAAEGAKVWAETAGSEPAQAEAKALVQAWGGAAILDEGRPALLAAARVVADDLCLMERRARGWALTAISLSAGTFFTAEQAIGKPLRDLHEPVPGFGEHLLGRVERIFDRLAPDQVIERRNWTVLNSDQAYLPDPAPVRARLRDGPQPLFLRVERQTLRRLPVTSGVVFSIRVSIEPLERVLANAERRAAFARAWDHAMSEAGEPFRGYKRLDLYDALVRAALQGGAAGP